MRYSGFVRLSVLGLLLMGCAQATSKDAAVGVTSALFSPVGGAYASIPSQVDVTFSDAMDETTVTDSANWSFKCGGTERGVSDIVIKNGVASLALPDSGAVSGTSCVLQMLSTLHDAAGSIISGVKSVTYSIKASSSTSSTTSSSTSDTTITPVSNPPTGALSTINNNDRIFGTSVTLKATAAASAGFSVASVSYLVDGTTVGASSSAPYTVTFSSAQFANGQHTLSLRVTDNSGNESPEADARTITIANNDDYMANGTYGTGGNAFTISAPAGYNMSGINVRTGKYLLVDVVTNFAAIWQTGWGPGVATASTGFGGTGGTASQLMCPSSGNYRVVGLAGNSGDDVNSIGVICARQDGTGTAYYGPVVGGKSGTSYELRCTSGTFVTEVRGNATSAKIKRLQLVCR